MANGRGKGPGVLNYLLLTKSGEIYFRIQVLYYQTHNHLEFTDNPLLW